MNDAFTTARAELNALAIVRNRQLGTDTRERLIRQDALAVLDRLEAAVMDVRLKDLPAAAAPCPFCGTATEALSFGYSGYGVGARLWHIRCSSVECNAIGPTAPTVAEARVRWNVRVPCAVCAGQAADYVEPTEDGE